MFKNMLIHLLLFAVSSFFLMNIIFNILKKFNWTDGDNLKLNSSKLTVTSLGISFLICFSIFTLYLYFTTDLKNLLPNRFYIFFVSLFLLTVISFIDDKKEIDPKLRLIFQLILVYFTLTNLQLNKIELPLKLSIFLTLTFWVYLINITNFIDGSDGHCAMHVLFFMIGILIMSYIRETNLFSNILAFILIPILSVFLIFFNKPRAKAYMGDAGSIFLGFIVGFIILEYAIMQKEYFVISLFLYPILDCSITLIKKTLKGHYPWERLSDYYFLIPIKISKIHGKVFVSTFIYNLFNLIFFIMQLKYSEFFFICNLILSFVLLFYFKSFSDER